MASVRASHIVIKHKNSRNPVSRRTGATVTQSLDDAIKQLEAIKSEITPDNFAEFARNYSDCSSCKQGGDLGFFSRGQMQQPFETAAFSLSVGKISDIIQTDSGVHLIYRTA